MEKSMKYSVRNCMEAIFSFAVFAAITLAVATTTYQLLNPDGGLINWISRAWELNPMSLVVLGGVALLVKRWLSGSSQGAKAANMMLYTTLLLGLYYGSNLLIAA
jgi:hypothetical protein